MSGDTTRRGLGGQYDSPAGLVTALGLLLGVTGIAYVVTHPEPVTVWAIEFALVGVPAAAIVYGGYWIARHHVPREDEWNIAKWSVAGAVIAALLLLGYVRAEQLGGETVINPELLVILGALGGGTVALFATISNERRHLTGAAETAGATQLEEMDAEPLSADGQILADLASDTRSWYVVRALRTAGNPLGVESIADRIATLEGVDPRDVYVDLVHARLPKLAEWGLVQYDSAVDVVQLDDRVDAVANASDELARAGEQLTTGETGER